MRLLCVCYAPAMRLLCVCYAPAMRPLCARYAPAMRLLCGCYAAAMLVYAVAGVCLVVGPLWATMLRGELGERLNAAQKVGRVWSLWLASPVCAPACSMASRGDVKVSVEAFFGAEYPELSFETLEDSREELKALKKAGKEEERAAKRADDKRAKRKTSGGTGGAGQGIKRPAIMLGLGVRIRVC